MTDATASPPSLARGGSERGSRAFLAALVVTAAVLVVLPGVVGGSVRAGYLLKFGVAAAALVAVLYERRRTTDGRPFTPRLRRAATVVFAVLGVVAYYQRLPYAYPRVFHVWEHYHYYLGAKYFREIGYDGLYRCSLVALDARGGTAPGPDGKLEARVDVRAEGRDPARHYRDLTTYRVVPAAEALADPAWCTRRFTPARWAAFGADVAFFREASSATHWDGMLRDHGFNPPPGWLLAATPLASLGPASDGLLLPLAALDVLLLAGAFGAIAWAFGGRAAALAVVFWGTQAFSPYGWTGGAFLRQDWLFLLVLSLCLARRRWYAASGAALAASALLRAFPLLFAAGWAVVLLHGLVRRRRVPRPAMRALLGGLAATAVLLPASVAVAGRDAYAGFAEHTLRLHGETPLSNHMGGRTLLAYAVGLTNPGSRLEDAVMPTAPNPHAAWSLNRRENDQTVRPAVYVLAVLAFAALFVAARRRAPWVAMSLSTIFVAFSTQLTCYYYVFLVVLAPLSRRRWQVAPLLLATAAASQVVYVGIVWNDDKFAAETVLALAAVAAAGLLFALPPRVFSQTRPAPPLPGMVGDPSRTGAP